MLIFFGQPIVTCRCGELGEWLKIYRYTCLVLTEKMQQFMENSLVPLSTSVKQYRTCVSVFFEYSIIKEYFLK